jgi:hypothetical protein
VLLRESGKARNETYDLRAVTDPTVDSGLENGDILQTFATTVCGAADSETLSAAREAIVSRMGSGALVQAAAIVANFSKNDRVANATGIPLEKMFVRDSEAFREDLGINAFRSAKNTLG